MLRAPRYEAWMDARVAKAVAERAMAAEAECRAAHAKAADDSAREASKHAEVEEELLASAVVGKKKNRNRWSDDRMRRLEFEHVQRVLKARPVEAQPIEVRPRCEVCHDSCERALLFRCKADKKKDRSCDKYCHSYCAGFPGGLPAGRVLYCLECSAERGSKVHFSVLLGLERRTERLEGHREHLHNLGYEDQLDDDQLSRRIALCEGIQERTVASSENPFAEIRRRHFLRSLEAEQPEDGQRGRVVGWLGKRAVDSDGFDGFDEDGRLSVRFLLFFFCRAVLWISKSNRPRCGTRPGARRTWCERFPSLTSNDSR
jgi:hypothetical protein